MNVTEERQWIRIIGEGVAAGIRKGREEPKPEIVDYTRELLVKSAETLKNFCGTIPCEKCPFDDGNNCKIDVPDDWDL